jgi:hypothetical protein
MATTTNFGWETPDDVDLVKDGAAAMRTLGNSIDASFVDLKGGTSGQILSKASATDLDYTWITNDQGDLTAITAGTGITVTNGTGPIPSVAIDSTVTTLTGTQTLTNKTLTSPVLTTPTISTIDAKGDLLAGTADNTIGRLAVGANGTVLTADSSAATGLKWAAGGGKVLQVVSVTKSDTFSTSSSTFTDITGLSASITPSATTSKILVIYNMSGAASQNAIAWTRLMRDSTAINIGDTAGSRNRSTSDAFSSSSVYSGTTVAGSFLDSPATTSSTTYKLQTATASGAMYVNRGQDDTDAVQRARTVSTITLMEIGA